MFMLRLHYYETLTHDLSMFLATLNHEIKGLAMFKSNMPDPFFSWYLPLDQSRDTPIDGQTVPMKLTSSAIVNLMCKGTLKPISCT